MRHAIFSITCFALTSAGCTSDTASHIPNPLLVPIQATQTGISNATYDARRNRVKAHVEENHSAIVLEVVSVDTPLLNRAMDLARVPDDRRDRLHKQLAKDMAIYVDDPDALVTALMVHGT